MLWPIRNLIISIMAVFIRDKEARHNFRNKYKRKSKFRKLRDDNKKLFDDNKMLEEKLEKVQHDMSLLKTLIMNHTWLEPLNNNPNIYLSVACISKDEAPYIKEWIEYHKIVGVERFYFYDNESSDNTKEVLKPYIDSGEVIYKYVEGKLMQVPSYQDAILMARGQTRWLALIDLDEFIVPIEKNSVPEFLKDFEQYPGIGINSLIFDYNGHRVPPKENGGLVTANYVRVPKNPDDPCNKICIKSIVNPMEVVSLNNPHIFQFRNYGTVTENCELTGSLTKHYSASKIRINHYIARSAEDVENKQKKGSAATRRYVNYKPRELNILKDIETRYDYEIKKFLPKLKDAMGIKSCN